jgi:hypothetical protein
MKKLLILLGIAAVSISASAQSTTNIAYKVTVETVTGGVTNSVNTNFRYDWGTTGTATKDQLKIAGLVQAYNTSRAGGFTNDFGAWLKQDNADRAKSYQDAKEASDNAALVAKLTSLLLTNPDLLSASDLTSLNTIAAKAP